MRKKKLLTAAVSLSLVAVIGVGATLAYFTDTDTRQNTFTTGKVDIVLNNFSPEVPGMVTGEPTPEGGVTYTNVLPGDVLSKDVSISVVHDSAEMRLAVLVTTEHEANATVPTSDEILKLVDNEIVANGDFKIATTYFNQNFNGKQGTLYIMEGTIPQSENNQNLQLMTKVAIPGEEWDNEYADVDFNITFTAYAAQAANLTAEQFETMAFEQAQGMGEHFENYGYN